MVVSDSTSHCPHPHKREALVLPTAAAPRAGEFHKDWILGVLSQLLVQLFHRVYHHHDAYHMPPRRLSPVSQFHPLAAAIVFAAMLASADAVTSDAANELNDVARKRYCDPAIATISAWLVLVTSLEINDFRYCLKLAYGRKAKDKGNIENIGRRGKHYLIDNVFLSDNNYVASLVAIRLGLRDAIIDAVILYFLTYAVVVGLTWSDVDVESNFLLIIRGISYMVSASMLASIGWKIPLWLGFYRKSNFNFLKDTSYIAPQAVLDHVFEGSSLASFRYQVRLGVGKHTISFVILLLPFYVNLKVHIYFISLLVGLVFGCVYQYTVFMLRQRYKRHRGKVAMGASAVLLLISSAVFMAGIRFIDIVWNWNLRLAYWKIGVLSYFLWLTLCLIILGMYYYEQKLFILAEDDENQEEELVVEKKKGDDIQMSEEYDTTGKVEAETVLPGEDKRYSTGCSESEEPMNNLANRRDFYMKDSMESYIYETVYFDRMTLTGRSLSRTRLERESTDDRDKTTKEIHDEIAAVDEPNRNIKWYHRLPFLPVWHVLRRQNATTWSCCRKNSDFYKQPCQYKVWHVFVNTLRILIRLVALFLTVIVITSTAETRTALAKLPESFKISYEKQNEGAVCAFDEKFGNIREFASKDEAHLANYTIAHCGPCGACSTWNDLQVQYSTRHSLALLGRKCAQKTILGGAEAAFDCVETTIGFKGDCARCWVDSFLCSKKFCSFIFLQSTITNRIANFKVSPKHVTSAMCSEASCEAGNPGAFVRCSGANRRKMGIKSDIKRPLDEQCRIVDVDDWGSFFGLE